MKNAEVLYRVKQEHPTHIKKRKANWIGHILGRNGLLKHATEGEIEGTSTRGRRGKQLLDDLNEGGYPEVEIGSTRSYSVKNTLGERLCTCRKTDYVMMRIIITIVTLYVFSAEIISVPTTCTLKKAGIINRRACIYSL